MIQQVLPCGQPDGPLRACPGVLTKLRAQLAELDCRADELEQARQTLRQTIAAAEAAGLPLTA
ncbi:MerR family DNA-binding protein [Kitasatospora aureofaciens]|nr:MerR family DNA-binding protein [Kitasatospora aureofaciens]